MKTGISIELDGRSFAVDEPAFLSLRAYLDRARARLGAHPDRDEVLAGLERSIAAKLARRSLAGNTAIGEAEMQAALKEVGRVDGPSLDAGNAADDEQRSAPRRLYRVREGQQVAGVCTGLARYAEIDVGIVRLIFILGALFSGGMLVLAYVVLAFVMPLAHGDAAIGDGRGVPRA